MNYDAPMPAAADIAATARALPKVLLHDHLDGGLRPATLIELLRARGVRPRQMRAIVGCLDGNAVIPALPLVFLGTQNRVGIVGCTAPA